jgi:hypothetical protein
MAFKFLKLYDLRETASEVFSDTNRPYWILLKCLFNEKVWIFAKNFQTNIY